MVEQKVFTGVVVDEGTELTLVQLSKACGQPAEWVLRLVEEGIIEPIGREKSNWRFHRQSLRRIQIVQRLKHDLDVNLAGAALVLELLEEVEQLRSQLV